MVTIKNARAGFTIAKMFFEHFFPLLSCNIYQTPEALIKILSMLRIKLNLFLSPYKKSRLFEMVCSLAAVRETGHILPVFCPYLEIFTSLLWQL